MGNKKQTQTRTSARAVLSILMMVFLLMGIMPGISIAAEEGTTPTTNEEYTTLRGLKFVSDADSTLIVGEPTTVKVVLNRIPTSKLFTGSVNADITDPEGKVTHYSVSGGGGYYNLSNIALYTPGDYTLKVSAVSPNKGSASGIIKVLDAVTTVTGSLLVNGDNSVQVKVTDSEGTILQQKSVTVDGTAVDASPATQTYTTLNDGTFDLSMTPLKAGNVNIIYGGKIIGTIPVATQKINCSVTGSLTVNTNSTITAKLTDSAGNPLDRKSVSVDSSEVSSSAATQSYTTLNDGTFIITMTPEETGNVTITYGGDIVGTIAVNSAFTAGNRIGSQTTDNVGLSVEIAKQGWQSATNVILSRDDQFSDSLAAAPLSKKLDAPILMTGSSTLDGRTLAEIRELGATNVYIMGGTVAISQAVQDSLSSNGLTVTRLAGQQGYDTAALISALVGVNDTHTVYIANGNAIPDAIAASAFAAEQGNSILLTDRDQLPASTVQALTTLNVSNVVLLGGTAVISTQVANELGSKYAVKRWGGNDRYDTQKIVFENLLNTVTPQSPLYFTSGLVRQNDVSSGNPKADALLTAALAAKTGGFVAMLPQNDLLDSMNYFLLYNKGYIPKSAVVGNYSSVSGSLEERLQAILSR